MDFECLITPVILLICILFVAVRDFYKKHKIPTDFEILRNLSAIDILELAYWNPKKRQAFYHNEKYKVIEFRRGSRYFQKFLKLRRKSLNTILAITVRCSR